MNPTIKNKLRTIFAREIGKDVSELNGNDMELFEDWIATGLAAEHIKIINLQKVAYEIYAKEVVMEEKCESPSLQRAEPAKCRNCNNLVINTLYKPTLFGTVSLQLSIYCGYWYNKNRKGYRNSLYNVSLDYPACTQFLSHTNLLDLMGIDISGDVELGPFSVEEFASIPLTSFVDKGFNFKKIGNELFLYRSDKDGNEI